MQRNFKYVHFLLDLNYNMFQRGWLGKIARFPGWCDMTQYHDASIPVSLDASIDGVKIQPDDRDCRDYLKAMAGEEYWIDDKGRLQELKPMGPGDYLVAGMVGVNHLLFDVIYRPDAESNYIKRTPAGDFKESKSLLRDKIELDDGQGGYWAKSSYVGLNPESVNKNEKQLLIGGLDGEIGAINGRILKNHWDKQDDPSVYYKKVTMKGFELQKMIAIYTIANSGWFSDKYRMESMANSVGDGNAPGLHHMKFALLTEIANEDALLSMTPYCYDTQKDKVVRVNVPVNTLVNFLGEAPFFRDIDPMTGKPAHLFVKDLPSNLCAYYAEHTNAPASRYEPIHAGWIYFDKMWPMYWSMGGVANMSANTSVLMNFYTFTYPAYKKDNYPAPDVNEVATINSKGDMYFRAVLPSDTMTDQDRQDLAWWKNAKKNGETDEYALCEKDPTDNTKCLMNGSNPVVRKVWVRKDGSKILDVVVREVKQKAPAVQVELTRKLYTEYLRKKYARFVPAFRLVWDLSKVSGGENQLVSSDPAAQTVTIMETTLMQMNSFVNDHFSEAVQYKWY
jgi:hypothetical protein